ncbi:MAG: prepilin-type N-terminal cleavage/methylation domain-containing protein [Pseudomonadales bacterium]|nr:prepilin-type N-terminal cleavage/methylation domain-containing protein [Pseudomonadales bacterium]
MAGFTLLEVITVLVIAAILYFVALPGYQSVVVKSGRAAARGVLMDVMTRQEQYFINSKRYATSLAELQLPEPYYIDRQAQAAAEAQASYRVALDVREGVYIGVLTVPVNRQTADEACMTFSLDRTGRRAVSGSLSAQPAQCWN